MTDEEREEILQQAFRNISAPREANLDHGLDSDQDPLEAWAAGMPKPEEPRPARKLDTRRELQPSIYEWVEQRIQEERKFILEVAGGAIGQMLDQQLKQSKEDLADEVKRLRLELCELELSLTQLKIILAKERGLNPSSQLALHSVN